MDFFSSFPYTNEETGGVNVNEFEKNVQSKRNDAVDSGVGFAVSFGFFATLFIIATVIKLVAS
nr:YqzM family protein [Metabacillus flavus]